jgi:hypothetical protein
MTVPRRPLPALVGGLLAAALALGGCGSTSTADPGSSAASGPLFSAVPAPGPATSAPAIPPVTPPPSVDVDPGPGPSGPRPENGAVITKRGTSGRGELSIENGTDLDALVTLSLDGKAARAVYVRSSSTTELHGIADGTYEIFMAQGDGWNKDLRKFTDSPEYTKFEEPAPFETVRESGAIRYTRLRITLQPVIGGTAQTDPVDESAVPT